MKRNRKIVYIGLMVIALVLVVTGVSYAYFTAMATSNEQIAESGILQLTYVTGKDITLDNVIPMEEENAGIHQFSIENTGTMEATYYLYLTDIILQKEENDTQSNNLKWKLYSANETYVTSSEIATGDFSEGNNPIELETSITIQPQEKQYYVLKIWLQETGQPQNWDQGLNFSAKVEATTEKKTINRTLVSVIKGEAVLDNIASTYVTSPTGIDFSQISSDTNGKGLYILNGTENNQYPIMYYRGAVENNNVKFANFCWKIVRTTETGGVKLIYNGTPDESGQCTATGESTMINSSIAFNTNFDDNAYVGYMYGTAGSSTYEETHANTNDSTIKTVIDEWYSENMTTYTNKLEDTVWCNDRSVVQDSSYPGTGIGKEVTMYGAMNRLYVNKTPSLECKSENDRFTVSEENGNGALTYPIALLTADEIAYAGAVYLQDNGSYYLYDNAYWWSLSPSNFHSSNTNANAWYVNSTGYLYASWVTTSRGVRPAVSLKMGTKIIDGDGTVQSPYVIE